MTVPSRRTISAALVVAFSALSVARPAAGQTAIRFTLEKYVDAGLAGQTSAHLGSREKK